MGRNDTRSHTAPTNKAFLEVKGHRRRSNRYALNRASVYCTELNDDVRVHTKRPGLDSHAAYRSLLAKKFT